MRHEQEEQAQNCIDGEKVLQLQNWLAKGTLSTSQFKSRHCAQSAAIIKQFGQEGYEVSTHLPGFRLCFSWLPLLVDLLLALLSF